MLTFIFSLLFNNNLESLVSEEIYNKHQGNIISAISNAHYSASLLDKECYYDYGGYWDDNYIAINGSCYINKISYDVILIAKHSKTLNLEEKQFDWRRVWIKNFLENNSL